MEKNLFILIFLLLIQIFRYYADDYEFDEGSPCKYLPEQNSTLIKEEIKIIKSGLKEKNVAGKVVIIGAGITGLTTAMLLQDAGIKVKILEASEHIGGRIQTAHYNNPDSYLDHGAMRFPTAYSLSTTLFEMLNITTIPFSHNTHFYYINGERINGKLGPIELEKLSKLYGLKKKLTKSPFDIIDEVYADAWNIVKERGWNEAEQFLDKYSIEDWLIEFSKKKNMSEDGRLSCDMLAVFGGFEAISSTSFVESMRDECSLGIKATYVQVDGGSNTITKAMVEQKLKQTKIHLNARVVRIDQRGKQVEVKFVCDRNGINCDGGSGKVLADYVVPTTTPGATLRIKFKPRLDRQKTHALRKVHYDNAVKIFLIFKKPFWEDIGMVGGKIMSTLPLRATYFVDQKFSSGVGVMLASYTWGDDATYWSGMGENDAVKTSLEMVVEMFGPVAKEEFLEGHWKDWITDKYSIGAFTLLNPHQTYLHPYLEISSDRVSFAGDYTAHPHGWIENCIRSAIRASKETIAALKHY